MNRCPKCGTQFEGNFCPECGTKWQNEKTCPNCGTLLKGDVKFCNNCGYAFYGKPAPVPTRPQAAVAAQGDVPKKVLQYLPAGLFLLFSLLLWAFYAAPVFKANILIGTIEGNLYQIYGEEVFGDLHGAILALYIFTAFSCVAAAISLYFSYKNPKNVRFVLPLGFYLFFVVLGSVFIVKIGQEDLTAGACPILILVFSCAFALLTGAGWYFFRRVSAGMPPRAKQEPSVIRTAESGEPVPPVAVEKPVKPSLLRKMAVGEEKYKNLAKTIDRHVQNKRILASITGSFYWLEAVLYFYLLVLRENYDFASNEAIAYFVLCSIVWIGLLVVGPIVIRSKHLKEVHPEKVYRRRGIIATHIFSALLIFPSTVLVLPLFIFILMEINKGKRLSEQLCGYTHPKLNRVLVAQYEEERRAYERQLPLYKKYRHELTEYRYAAARYKSGKPFEGKPYAVKWAFTHKLAVGAVAVGLAAVIVATSCFFGMRDFAFSLGPVRKIGLGDETATVTKVLGEPFRKDEYVWIFYERKVVSLHKEMEELSEKAKNASSVSDLEKYMQKYAELEKELSEMTYKEIDIFFSDGAVTSVMFNTQAGNSGVVKKEAKSVTLFPETVSKSDNDVKVTYQIEYEDGSYQTAYLPAMALSQANLGKAGSYPLEWSDGWGDYKAVLNVL